VGFVNQQPESSFVTDTVEQELVYGMEQLGFERSQMEQSLEKVVELLEISDLLEKPLSWLSGGQQQRVAIAAALAAGQKILLLDEPTTGLDPQARHILWDRLFRLKEQGVTLVLTTHYMDEAEQLCDRIIVMDKGKIMAEGSPAELIRDYSSREVVELRFGTDKNEGVAKQLEGKGDRIELLPDRILLYTDKGEALLTSILDSGLPPVTSLVRRSSLEDVFLRLTGRTLVD
jgi:lipooligosaccharide transport system ATP-binding protein